MSEILVEVVPQGGANVPLDGSRWTERFEARAAEVADSLGSISQVFRSEFDRRAQGMDHAADGLRRWEMDEITLNLSLNLEAETGIVIARGKTGATFEASLKWRRS